MRRIVSVAALAVAVVAAVLSTPSYVNASDASGHPFLPYGEESFFQDELDGAPIDATLTSQFRSFMATHPDQKDTPYPMLTGTGSNKWGMVHEVGTCTDPVWKLDAGGNLPSQWAHLRTTGFHADAAFGSWFTGTNDSPFVVIDRCNGITVWAANAKRLSGNLVDFSAAGAFLHGSNGLDRRNQNGDSTKNERSRGVIPDSMLIRKDLMTWAKANDTDLGHVLEIFFVETDSAKGVTHPMVGSENRKSGWGAEGWRIAVSPSVNLAARNCSPEGLVIARTLQRYGGYLGDNSGSNTKIKAEQEHGGVVWGNTLTANELQGCITWNDFVVVRPGWEGKEGPQ